MCLPLNASFSFDVQTKFKVNFIGSWMSGHLSFGILLNGSPVLHLTAYANLISNLVLREIVTVKCNS